MNKQEFLTNLESNTLTKEEKIEVCQYFIDNYPIQIPIMDMFGGVIGHESTALKGTITGGSDEKVDLAFAGLRKHINKFKE